MWADVVHYSAAALILIGSGFAFIGAIGLVRLPDVYSRSHVASKAGTVGSGLVLLAVAISALETYVATRAISGLLFLLLTAPLSAHLLMRAAHKAGYPLYAGSVVDEMPKDSKPSEGDS